MKLCTAAQMQEIDRRTIEERGIAGHVLMEKAGTAIALDVTEHFETGSAAVLAGKGNNGGDGFVAARLLARAGWQVAVYYVAEPDNEAGAARAAWEQMPEAVKKFKLEETVALTEALQAYDLVIDALLGTGTKGKPRAPYDAYIEALNAAHMPVFSADIPSGLNPDTGKAEVAVRAFRTITMGLPKIGFVTNDGPLVCGSIRVEQLDFPKDLLDLETNYHTLTPQDAKALLPERHRAGHKGTFGLVAILAGSAEMPGAAVLCTYGALRGGCGLVRLHVPGEIRPIVAAQLPEALLSAPLGEAALVPLTEAGQEALLHKTNAVLIGPGMGISKQTGELLRQVLALPDLPVVVDADGLSLLADDEELRGRLRPQHVLTPHPGEAGKLLGISTKEVQEDRWGAAAEAARRFRCTVVLKGMGTLVAEANGRITHIPSGNSAWARGGAGDVLAGLTASLLAQGLEPGNAAKLACFVHGMAADIYTRDLSPRGALTREVADRLPQAFRELEAY